MSIVLVGLSHKTAPLEMRERLAFGESALQDALPRLIDHDTLDEGLIVSTCNRVELIASSALTPGKLILMSRISTTGAGGAVVEVGAMG